MKQDLPADYPAWCRHQTEEGTGQGGLPASRVAHDAQDLTRLQLEADVVDGRHHTEPGRVDRDKVADRQNRPVGIRVRGRYDLH